MMTFLALLLMTGATLGGGGGLIDLLGLERATPMRLAERVGWATAFGLGLLGWLLFLLGALSLLHPLPVAGLSAILTCVGIPGWRRNLTAERLRVTWSVPVALLTAATAVTAALSLAEALAPPTDGDSMAYHFAIARDMVNSGSLVFVPRAIDGAVPLSLQITYAAARVLGGEQAMTLWCALTGWGSGVFLYGLARRWLQPTWAWAVALAWTTMPAVIYGANSGQAEVRTALFATAAVIAQGRSCAGQGWRWAVAAGLATGAFVASKYTGLLFAFALGLTLLASPSELSVRDRFRHAALLTAVTVLAGCQWYGWNWFNSGDPVFPMLARWLPLRDPALWPSGFDLWAVGWREGEMAVPRSVAWFLAYPIVATFTPFPQFEAGRTGWGMLPILLLPFALAGVWRKKSTLVRHPLASVFWVVLVFATLWFFTAPSQRIRHFVPLLPATLLLLSVAAVHGGRQLGLSRPLAVGLAIGLVLQLAGQAVYGARYVSYLVTHEERQDFLRRSISAADAAFWLNAHLGPNDRVVHELRQINYLLDVRYYFYHSFQQALIDPRPDAVTLPQRIEQIRRLGVTHALLSGPPARESGSMLATAVEAMAEKGCAHLAYHAELPSVASRTLGNTSGHLILPVSVWTLDQTCPAFASTGP